jgi:hypothetical protein
LSIASDEAADLLGLARDGGHVGDVLVALDGHGKLLDLVDDGRDRRLDPDLELHRVGARGDVAEAFVDHGLGQDRRRGGAVTGHVVGLGRDLAQQLRARVLHRVLELDLAHDRHAVVGDRGGAEFLLEDHVAALGAERDAHCRGDDVDALLEGLSRLYVECDLFCHITPLFFGVVLVLLAVR